MFPFNPLSILYSRNEDKVQRVFRVLGRRKVVIFYTVLFRRPELFLTGRENFLYKNFPPDLTKGTSKRSHLSTLLKDIKRNHVYDFLS